MNHSTDTPKQFTAVSGHTHLFRREGGAYYFRAKVPHRIRKLVEKTELRISLRIKNLKEAKSAVKIEALKAEREFSEAEAKLRGEVLTTASRSDEEPDTKMWSTGSNLNLRFKSVMHSKRCVVCLSPSESYSTVSLRCGEGNEGC